MAPLSGSCPGLRRFGISHAARSLTLILAHGRRGRTTVRAVRRVRVLGESILQFLRVYAWLLEWAASAAVREGQQGRPFHVVEYHFVPGVPGRQRTRGLRCHEIAAQAVDAEFRAEGRYPEQDVFVQPHAAEAARRADSTEAASFASAFDHSLENSSGAAS